MTTNRVRFLRVSIALVAAALVASGVSAGDVRISAVEGQWAGDRAEVVWTTELALGTIGFNLYRIGNGDETRVNDILVCVGFGDSGQGAFRVVDPAQALGDEATYRLDAVRPDGSPSTLGVWTVRFEEAAPQMQVFATLEEPLLEPLSAPESGPALKVMVERPDIYAVSYEAIAAGLGWTVAAVETAVATRALAMRVGDAPVAYLPDPDEQRILFYGWGIKIATTRHNAFWIEPVADGTARHIPREAPEEIAVSGDLTFSSTEHFEEEAFINPSIFSTLPDDLHRWMTFSATNPSLNERVFDVPLEGYASGDVFVSLRVTGLMDYGFAMTPHHRAEIRFNNSDELLGFVTFDGTQNAVATATVPSSLVEGSGNQLKVKAVLLPWRNHSIFANDWFTTTYTRYYAPANGLLLATDGGHARLGAPRFDKPLVFDVTDPYAPVWIALEDGSLPSTHSWAVDGDTEWAFRERDAVASAPPLPAGSGGWMLDPANRVDYLVIAPRAFADPAKELADYRDALGLRTAVAFYEDICDQFGGGLNNPEAIRAMLAHAHQHWAAAPWMVVLGGWGHYDYLGATTSAFNPLPPLLGTDGLADPMLRADDNLLADLNGDGWPDVAIGRIPVGTASQFYAYLAKVQAYELDIPQEWADRAKFVAGEYDPAAGDFTETNQLLVEETVKRYEEENILQSSRDWSSASVVRVQLLEALDMGSGIMHYTGHAGPYHLGSNGDSPDLLHRYDVLSPTNEPVLTNEPVPLFMMLTCRAGRFDQPLENQRSLAESLILSPHGALAVYAASGDSINAYAEPFGTEFYRLHAEDRTDTLGPALLRARRAQPAIAMRTYNLLGDPALKLRNGDSGGCPPTWVSDFSFWRWEAFKYDELTEDYSAAEAVAPGERLSNLMLYATGGTRGEDQPSSGWRLVHADPIEGITIDWQRRSQATDVEHLIEVSEDLQNWETQPADLVTETIGSDGVREQLQSMIHRPEADRLFIRLRVTADSL